MAEKENSNINITPDMIQNLANMLTNSNNNQKSNIPSENNNVSNNNTSNSDNYKNSTAIFNNLFENKNTNSSTSNLDFDTILKMKSIFEKINNKNNPRNNLLYSLKPYLRESRQKKLDQYVNLLSISEITSLFKKEKGDEN